MISELKIHIHAAKVQLFLRICKFFQRKKRYNLQTSTRNIKNKANIKYICQYKSTYYHPDIISIRIGSKIVKHKAKY